MAADPQGRAAGWDPADNAATTFEACGIDDTPAISYRATPAALSSGEIASELTWIGDAVSWHGPLGDHARQRAAALRAELQRREGVPR